MNIYIYYYVVIPKIIKRDIKMPLQILAHFMPIFSPLCFSHSTIHRTNPSRSTSTLSGSLFLLVSWHITMQ